MSDHQYTPESKFGKWFNDRLPLLTLASQPALTYAASSTPGEMQFTSISYMRSSSSLIGASSKAISSDTCFAERGFAGIPSWALSFLCCSYSSRIPLVPTHALRLDCTLITGITPVLRVRNNGNRVVELSAKSDVHRASRQPSSPKLRTLTSD